MKLPSLSAPLAIVIGAAIIAIAVLAGQLLTPYRVSSISGSGSVVWRVNGNTGEIRRCNYEPEISGWPAKTVCP